MPLLIPGVQSPTLPTARPWASAGTDTDVEDGLWNWQDMNNRLVTVRPGHGLVTTSEVYAVPSGNTWKQSRNYASEGQTQGGR